MFHKISAVLTVWALAVLRAVQGRAAGQARAATFIEYALLAVIAIIVAALFRNQLSGAFNTILGRISGAMNQG